VRAALGFIAIAAVAGVLIGATRFATSERIERNQHLREAAIIAELLAAGGNSRDPDSQRSTTDVAARLCRTQVRGYAGLIKLLVLPDTLNAAERTIEAVRVLGHQETPGIGDFIELDNSPWILGFNNQKTLPQPTATSVLWQNQLDAMTGATITRRAVIEGVANACLFDAPRGADPLFGKPVATP